MRDKELEQEDKPEHRLRMLVQELGWELRLASWLTSKRPWVV